MSSTILPSTTSPINPTPALELTEAELLVVQKWTKLYVDAEKTERYQMLTTKILPRLLPLNKDLPRSGWKVRKSVSKAIERLCHPLTCL
jgi:hypothetical protein